MKMFLSISAIIITLNPTTIFAKTKVSRFDRDGYQYNEERQTTVKRGHQTIKVTTELDTNKDKKYDREITIYFHHDRMKSYKITKTDRDFDGTWDQKQIEIESMSALY